MSPYSHAFSQTNSPNGGISIGGLSTSDQNLDYLEIMLKDPAVKRSIIASIIAALLVVFLIEPALNLLGEVIVWAGKKINDGISNRMYSNAALGQRDVFSFMVLIIILSSIVGIGKVSHQRGHPLAHRTVPSRP